jgi:hypothetical protein
VNLAVGSFIAATLYGKSCPVLSVDASDYRRRRRLLGTPDGSIESHAAIDLSSSFRFSIWAFSPSSTAGSWLAHTPQARLYVHARYVAVLAPPISMPDSSASRNHWSIASHSVPAYAS